MPPKNRPVAAVPPDEVRRPLHGQQQGDRIGGRTAAALPPLPLPQLCQQCSASLVERLFRLPPSDPGIDGTDGTVVVVVAAAVVVPGIVGVVGPVFVFRFRKFYSVVVFPFAAARVTSVLRGSWLLSSRRRSSHEPGTVVAAALSRFFVLFAAAVFSFLFREFTSFVFQKFASFVDALVSAVRRVFIKVLFPKIAFEFGLFRNFVFIVVRQIRFAVVITHALVAARVSSVVGGRRLLRRPRPRGSRADEPRTDPAQTLFFILGVVAMALFPARKFHSPLLSSSLP
jgi:hypothetical protein